MSPQQGGVSVNEDSARTYSAISACVRIISETMASLPWKVYRRMPTGREPLPKHGAQWLLNVQANPEQTAFRAKRTMLAHLLYWGNAYAEIERGLDGRAIWLWPVEPYRVCPKRDPAGNLIYEITNYDGAKSIVSPEDMFHIADESPDGLVGESRVRRAARSLGVGMAQDVFAASYYANGAILGGVIEDEKSLSPEAVTELLRDFNEKYAGPSKAHKTFYLDRGMTYKPLTLPLGDAQFLETRRFQVEDIARWYGVPLHLLNDLTNANYAISYEASKNFVEHTLRPLAVALEQEANAKLFGARSMGTIFSAINLNGLMRADPRTRGEYYRTMLNAGVFSINEIRELEEMNAIGSAGDEHYIQVNMTTIDAIANGETPQQPLRTSAPAEDI